MANPLNDLLEAIKKGNPIDVTVIDLSDGTNPLGSSDAYLRVMGKLSKLKRIEQLAQNIYKMLTDVGHDDKAETLRLWLNSISEPIDIAIDQLERERKHTDADTIEKEMLVIADALDPIIAHARKAIIEITNRHQRAIGGVDFSDLLVPVPHLD